MLFAALLLLVSSGSVPREEPAAQPLVARLLPLLRGSAFQVPAAAPRSVGPRRSSSSPRMILEDAQERFKLFTDAMQSGSSGPQAYAEAAAGVHDRAATERTVQELAQSAPLVVFTWESWPSCKNALSYLEKTGAKPKVVRLDESNPAGKPQKAALGRMTSKSSVPHVYIGGEFVGGFDGGPNEQAPGLVDLAFSGELEERLKAAGALA